ncbi:glycosyltransferase 87 family protein [Streptomyces sp. NPDC059477]|uniref:glycosyltransferase 87 family protein n=1 Tax=Streptomyces sp. NPDC059477 TaxID=3346847 RepID=UPI003698134E
MTHRSEKVTPRVALAVCFASLAAFLTLCAVHGLPMADVLVYRAEGAAVAGGRDLYGFTVTEWQLPATYPPFAALLFTPLAWLPLPLLKGAFLIGNLALLACLIHLSTRLAGHPTPRPDGRVAGHPMPRPDGRVAGHPMPRPDVNQTLTLCTATALALWLEPVFQTLLFGQINLALACLVLWDLTRAPGARGTGVAIGVAAGVKLTPAVFIAYLLLRGRYREAATAVAAFVGTVALGALVLPRASLDFWTRHLHDTGRVGKPWIVDNQSLQGLIARALGDPHPGLAWVLPAAVVAVAGLWLVRRAPDEPTAVLLAAGTALLVCPISWSHHWVWCVPLIALLLARGRLALAAVTALLCTARTMWLVPHQGALDLQLPWWQQPLASPYALLGLALLLGAAAQPSARSSSASTIRYA